MFVVLGVKTSICVVWIALLRWAETKKFRLRGTPPQSLGDLPMYAKQFGMLLQYVKLPDLSIKDGRILYIIGCGGIKQR